MTSSFKLTCKLTDFSEGLTSNSKFQTTRVFPVKSNRVRQIVMEIVKVSSFLSVNCFSLGLLTM